MNENHFVKLAKKSPYYFYIMETHSGGGWVRNADGKVWKDEFGKTHYVKATKHYIVRAYVDDNKRHHKKLENHGGGLIYFTFNLEEDSKIKMNIYLQKLCEECGVIYKKTESNKELCYYDGKIILKYDPNNVFIEYKNYIFVATDVNCTNSTIYFSKIKNFYNDEYNIDLIKKTLTNTIIKYKQIKQEQKEKNIQKDFE